MTRRVSVFFPLALVSMFALGGMVAGCSKSDSSDGAKDASSGSDEDVYIPITSDSGEPGNGGDPSSLDADLDALVPAPDAGDDASDDGSADATTSSDAGATDEDAAADASADH